MKNIDEQIRVKRAPKRGLYDLETIYKILDKNFLCHVSFIHDNYPVIIPTLYGRIENHLYIHGSNASRMIKDLQKGIAISISVTQVDGLVLARSAFHHSMNYQSVVAFGTATSVENETEKMSALKAISDHVIMDRWEEVRLPNEKEMGATTVLKLPLDKASAKIRKGGPVDDKDDYQLDIWAGEIPITRQFQEPIPDELLRQGTNQSNSVIKAYQKS